MNANTTPSQAPSYSLGELATHCQLTFHGSADIEIRGVAPLGRAQPGQLGFLAQSRHRPALADCQASALILSQGDLEAWQGAALISNNPLADFARIATLFEYRPQIPDGVHRLAHVDPTAELGAHVCIGPGASIGAHAKIADHCVIGPGCVIEDHVQVGQHSRLMARVYLGHHTQVGQHCLLHPGTVIGADGFGQAWAKDHWVKIPQLGRVVIGDHVEVGANTSIDRGALDDTVIEDGVRIDNLVQIAHNVRIGAHTAIAACVGIAGSAIIGRYCLIGGAASILGHIQICDRVVVQGMSSITHSIDEPGEYGSAVAAQDARTWRKNLARLRNLDKTIRELIRHKKS